MEEKEFKLDGSVYFDGSQYFNGREKKVQTYVSERIVNISELENYINLAYIGIQQIRNEVEKDNSSIQTIDELSKGIHLNLLKSKDFEFCIEQRKIFYCE